MHKIIPILLLALMASGCAGLITLEQPTIVGQPGRVFQSTEAEVSIDVVNNTLVVGDILVGETLVYAGVGPTEVKNIGFSCGGILILETSRQRLRSNGPRTEYIYFRPRGGRHRIESTQVNINCGSYRSKNQWNITYVSPLSLMERLRDEVVAFAE